MQKADRLTARYRIGDVRLTWLGSDAICGLVMGSAFRARCPCSRAPKPVGITGRRRTQGRYNRRPDSSYSR
jgi:hypothetical protein